MKACAEKLRLVFVTSVSKLHTLSSGLTVFKDIPFDREFSSILSFTSEDFKISFRPHIEQFAKKQWSDYNGMKKVMEQWYGWYLDPDRRVNVWKHTN